MKITHRSRITYHKFMLLAHCTYNPMNTHVYTQTYILVPVSRRLVRWARALQGLPHITVVLFTLDEEVERIRKEK